MTNTPEDVGREPPDRSALDNGACQGLQMPPEPIEDQEVALVNAVASVVLDWFGEPQHWFRGCSESAAQIIGCHVLSKFLKEMSETR